MLNKEPACFEYNWKNTAASNSVADPYLFGHIQIRILALINYPISTFLVCVKAINTSAISVVKLFGS
jgi:selenophosphate synthase